MGSSVRSSGASISEADSAGAFAATRSPTSAEPTHMPHDGAVTFSFLGRAGPNLTALRMRAAPRRAITRSAGWHGAC